MLSLREVPFDDVLVKGIWEIYNETPVRQGREFPHYGKDLETVHREEATFLDRSVFIGAFLQERLIGFVKLVADETRDSGGSDEHLVEDSRARQGSDECTHRTSRSIMRKAWDQFSRLFRVSPMVVNVQKQHYATLRNVMDSTE